MSTKQLLGYYNLNSGVVAICISLLVLAGGGFPPGLQLFMQSTNELIESVYSSERMRPHKLLWD